MGKIAEPRRIPIGMADTFLLAVWKTNAYARRRSKTMKTLPLFAAALALLLSVCSTDDGGEGNDVTYGSLYDSRDGKTYKTVKIGTQTWMAENLNYLASGSMCYDDISANCTKWGRLYDWQTAKNACPSGWHLPYRSEWEALNKAVGGENAAGKKLKSKSGWNDYEGKSGNGTDDYGFSALPGGLCTGDGSCDGIFFSAGNYGSWWTSSDNNGYTAYSWSMSCSYEKAGYGLMGNLAFLSLRCVRD
jgi:uncharacterized protein (TIGR02145 family)